MSSGEGQKSGSNAGSSQESEELRKLKEQYALMEERLKLEKISQNMDLELVKAKIDLLKQVLPAGTDKALAGTTTMDKDFSQIAEQVAYHALGHASAQINAELVKKDLGKDANIMIVDKLDFASGDIPLVDLQFQFGAFKTQIQEQTEVNQELIRESKPPKSTGIDTAAVSKILPLAPMIASIAPAALQLAPAALGLISDVMGFFRKNYEVTAAKFSLKQEGLLAIVAGKLKAEHRTVYIFNYYLLDAQYQQSETMMQVREIQSELQKLGESQVHLSSHISEVNESPAEKKNKKDWLEKANTADKVSTQLQVEVTLFLKAIASSESADKVSKLGQAILREKIRELKISHLLYLGMISSGGGIITRQELFGRSGNTSHIGGAVVNYVLSTVKGEVIASDTVPYLCSLEYDLSGERKHRMRHIKFENQ